MKKDYLSKSLSILLLVGIGAVSLYAWTGPTALPPDNGNIASPINTSSTAQTKLGNFFSTGLISGTTGLFNSIRLVTGAGAGKVLTSDASGNASWQTALSSSGVTLTDVKSSRTVNVVYPNGIGKPMFVSISLNTSACGCGSQNKLYIDNNLVQLYESGTYGGGSGYGATLTGIVPAGSTYKVTSDHFGSVAAWTETIFN